jgi:phosphatidylserine/phosphatidylglycerophosphate/cardiolipin synthase-like enzyme
LCVDEYITNSKFDVVGSAALVGSSNFTLPGLTKNVELNIQIRREVETLQEWFEQHWKEAEDVTPEILKTVERHTREYSPFEVYAKALYEYFKGHELTASEWELRDFKNIFNSGSISKGWLPCTDENCISI